MYVGTPKTFGDNITKSGRKVDFILENGMVSHRMNCRDNERLWQRVANTLQNSIGRFCIKAWGADDDIIARLVKKTLFVGIFAFIIGNWNALARIVFESFAGLGLIASGGSLSAGELLQPGRIAQVGLDAGRPLLEAIGELMGFVSFFENFIQIAILMFAWVIVLLSFFILAIQLFVTLIEFKLATLADFVLVPLSLFGKTALMAERVLGLVISSGVKVLVLTVIFGIGLPSSASSPPTSPASRPSKTRWPSCLQRCLSWPSGSSAPASPTASSPAVRS